MYTAFIDFSTAFDKVDRPLLWSKLLDLGMPGTLLELVRALHMDSWCRVLMGGDRGLSQAIPTTNGLKQGCLLAPLHFSLYISDLPRYLAQSEGIAPVIGGKSIVCLLYADGIIILDLTPRGLNSRLQALHKFAEAHHLKINISKSKIMCLHGRWKLKYGNIAWSVGGQKLELVKSYTFLGKIVCVAT